MPYPPDIEVENELVFQIYNYVGSKILRDKDNTVTGIDRTAIIPILQFFSITPDKSVQLLNDLDIIVKIINNKKVK